MPNAERSPEPWTVVDEPDADQLASDGQPYETRIFDAAGEPIAHVYAEDTAVQDANARLLVASPRLLAALHSIAADAPEAEPEYRDWGGDTEAAEQWGEAQAAWLAGQVARAAIAFVEKEA